jgi:hypothetical protein
VRRVPTALARTLATLLTCAMALVACASGTTDTSSVGVGDGSFPVGAAHPAPNLNTFYGCPSEGDGGDPKLNTYKNRTDDGENGVFHDVSVATILSLPWPQTVGYAKRSTWSDAETQAIAQYEGIAVRASGYIVQVKHEGTESTNCHDTTNRDYHIWLAANANDDRSQAVVVEVTPRVQALRPGWQGTRLSGLVGAQVRISGWLLFDQEHPDQVGQTRGTIFEIHPIIHIEVASGGAWSSYDN